MILSNFDQPLGLYNFPSLIFSGFWFAFRVAAAFGFENLGTFSLAVNLVTYFNGVMHLELAEAANQVTNYMGTSYILCILVALLADTCTGRFKAVLISGTFEFLVC